MHSSPYLRGLCVLVLLSPLAHARQGTVAKVAIVSKEPFQLQIQTNATSAPQAQIVTSPERLVVDIPNALPGPELRGIPIRSGEVRGVRVSLFSTEPPVTRIVVDLNQPQWYRVTPNSSGLLVSLGSSETPVDTQSTIGWVSTRGPVEVRSASAHVGSVVAVRPAAVSKPARKGLSIEFSNGQMTIHSGGATLSEILYQIQKVTGAEIAIPAGTELDKVAADFGPGTPSEVLGQLLNGSGLNFVVVGQESNPNLLRSVILTRKLDVAEAPPMGGNPAQAAADNGDNEFQEVPPEAIAQQNGQPIEQPLPPDQNAQADQNAQPDPNVVPGQQQNPAGGPPPDPPPTY